MDKRMVLYRGSLKSCNYHCSYCPFSKHRSSEKELYKDREQWERFCDSIHKRAQILKIGALMVTPYGEALLHPWYWKGLGSLSGMEAIEAVGAQTNLSFPLERSLKFYEEVGGKREKLRLWATFHPEMIQVEKFAKACENVRNAGVLISAGAVGVPENLTVIQTLKKCLPERVYLWINKMDGLKRPYTQTEIQAFQAIDPFFGQELKRVKADNSQCYDRIFVEGDGKVRGCNISSVWKDDWYEEREELFKEPPTCTRKFCSCYLAYGGRKDFGNREMFGDYPLFRVFLS